MMITSTEQARKAIEEQEIKAGTILMDTDGVFQVTAVNLNNFIVVEAVEVEYTEEGDYTPTDKKYRWALVDLIYMEII